MKKKQLYIETKINCDFEQLWNYTQNPKLHQQWDLRFSEINYLKKEKETDPQLFSYATKIGFGLEVNGLGESVGTKTKTNGVSTSVLKFSSDNKISIIRDGSGYWKYIPEKDGIQFLTGYDYNIRWGLFGKVIDKVVFRPLMIWATAVSFDCLKKWLEDAIVPRQSLKNLLTVTLSQFVIAIIWIYQGVVPKLLFQDSGELAILKNTNLFQGYEMSIITTIGIVEILFGILLIFKWSKGLHYINIIALLLLGAGALFSDIAIYTLPFNPFSLTIAMICISVISILNIDSMPKSKNCITKQKI